MMAGGKLMNKPMTRNRQQGAVLVVSLVLMTVITLIGVATMQSTTLEMRAAGNAQMSHTAFEGGQSRIEFAASNSNANPVNYLVAIQTPADPTSWPVQTCDPGDGCVDGSSWKATAQVNFTGGCRQMIGYSLEDGRAPVMRTFEVVVNAQTSNGQSTSNQVQGVRHPAAGC